METFIRDVYVLVYIRNISYNLESINLKLSCI